MTKDATGAGAAALGRTATPRLKQLHRPVVRSDESVGDVHSVRLLSLPQRPRDGIASLSALCDSIVAQ
jgi:hypothetical protein